MLGNLYKITNTVSGKIYIGKTYVSIEDRWRDHIRCAFRVTKDSLSYVYNHKMARAIRKYGPDNFKIELISQYEEIELEQKEMEYIKKYDSYKNGYNSTLGGDGNKRDSKIEKFASEIVALYNDGIGYGSIADEYGVHAKCVRNLLVKHGIEIRQDTYREDNRIVMYDRHFNPIRVFNNKISVADWIINETDYAYHQRTLYTALSNSCKTGCIRYGHRWQLYEDLLYEDKIFRTKFDKEAYIQGKQTYQPEDKQYYIVDGALDSILKINKDRQVKSVKCKICGISIEQGRYCDKCQLQKELNKVIKRKEYEAGYKRVRITEKTCRCQVCSKEITSGAVTGMCNSCANVAAKGKIPKPSKEELNALLDRDLQNKQIAEIYDRSTSTISTWIRQYGLK